MIATESEASKDWLLPHSHKYVYTTKDAESSLAMQLRLVLVEIPSCSVFVGTGPLFMPVVVQRKCLLSRVFAIKFISGEKVCRCLTL